MGRRNKWKVNADKYKKVRKTKRTPVQECTRRILAYKNVCKQLKDLYKKENSGFSQAVQRENAVFLVFKSVKFGKSKRRHKNLSAAGARSYSHIVKVLFYARII